MAVAGGGVADPICANEQRTQSPAGNNPRARNVVVGTLSPGAHPGGLNGQDAYSNQLVAVSRESYPAARRGREGGADLEIGSEPVSNALRAQGSGGHGGSQVMQPGTATGVRRLTPRECERLQGFPDDWTALDGIADSARYRMLGNAVAVPCAEWIGKRIMQFNQEG